MRTTTTNNNEHFCSALKALSAYKNMTGNPTRVLMRDHQFAIRNHTTLQYASTLTKYWVPTEQIHRAAPGQNATNYCCNLTHFTWTQHSTQLLPKMLQDCVNPIVIPLSYAANKINLPDASNYKCGMINEPLKKKSSWSCYLPVAFIIVLNYITQPPRPTTDQIRHTWVMNKLQTNTNEKKKTG